jgi:hypothetical protein
VSSYTRQRANGSRRRVGQDPYGAFLAFVKRERSLATWEHHQTVIWQLQTPTRSLR